MSSLQGTRSASSATAGYGRNGIITFSHIQAALIVFLGYSALEHYRLPEVLTDFSRFSSWPGRLFFLSVLAYTAAFTYSATELTLLMNDNCHRECDCPECALPSGIDDINYDEDDFDTTELGKILHTQNHQPSPSRPTCNGNSVPSVLLGRPVAPGIILPALTRPLLPAPAKSLSLATQPSSAVGEDYENYVEIATQINARRCTAIEPVAAPPAPRPINGEQSRIGFVPEIDPESMYTMPRTLPSSINTRCERRRSVLKQPRLARRVSVVELKGRKRDLSVAFARVKKPQPSAFERVHQTLEENEYDLITCRTLAVDIYIPLILGHASVFLLGAYVLATFPFYGWAAAPLIILVYAGVMNTNSLMRALVPSPTKRWVSVTATFLGMYYYRTREHATPPDAFSASAGDPWSILLISLGVLIGAFYAAFVLGCSIQCALKEVTIQDLYERICASLY